MVLKKTMCPKKTCSQARVPPSGGGGITGTGVDGLSGAGAGGILRRTEVDSDDESDASEEACTISFSGSIVVDDCDLYGSFRMWIVVVIASPVGLATGS
jgi:hypothetical protein